VLAGEVADEEGLGAIVEGKQFEVEEAVVVES
jgi:hypothetical protein